MAGYGMAPQQFLQVHAILVGQIVQAIYSDVESPRRGGQVRRVSDRGHQVSS